jgi:hypothetical protein
MSNFIGVLSIRREYNYGKCDYLHVVCIYFQLISRCTIKVLKCRTCWNTGTQYRFSLSFWCSLTYYSVKIEIISVFKVIFFVVEVNFVKKIGE